MNEIDFTATTSSTFSTLSGNTIEFGEKENHFYVLEQRDIEFFLQKAWIDYERKYKRDQWGNFTIGLIVGLIITALFFK